MAVSKSPEVDSTQPVEYFRGYLTFEIVDLADVDASEVFIEWQIDVPKGWTLEPGLQPVLSGTTHRSVPRWSSGKWKYTAVFNHILKLDFVKIPSTKRDAMPRVHLTAKSVDSYHRFQSQGYCTCRFPKLAAYNSGQNQGMVEKVHQMWTPKPPSTDSEMRRFFLGNAPELLTVNSLSTHIPVLNKYGQSTESCGFVRVRCSAMFEKTVIPKKITGTLPIENLAKLKIAALESEGQSERVKSALDKAKQFIETIKQKKKGGILSSPEERAQEFISKLKLKVSTGSNGGPMADTDR